MRRLSAVVGALPTLASLLIVLAILAVGCDDGSPTKSPPTGQEDYAVYMREGMNPGWIFAYHPTTYWLAEESSPYTWGCHG